MATAIFDSQNPKYRCFFGKVHVTTATKWICYFYFTLVVIVVGAVIAEAPEFHWIMLVAVLIGLGIDGFIFATPIYAVKTEKPKWLFPYLIASLSFLLVLCNIFDGYCIGYDLVYKTYEDAWILLDIFDFIINIWFVTIVYRCYEYLTEKNQSNFLPMSFSNKNIETMPFVLEENI